ncbi:MAG TPA: hypothetical protein VKZ56_05225 [Membranihabitans sp.]|nr:hypothetical protein [Membranihabitans sp.]
MWFVIWLVAFFAKGMDAYDVYYRSELLQPLELKPYGRNITILDDQLDSVEIISLTDASGLLYWHRKIYTPVCQTGECKEIDVGIYWKCNGEFLGLEVYNEHLTKTDHSVFSDTDYLKLVDVLMNDWSILREYEYDDLLSEPLYETEGSDTDAVTGATRKEIADETVADAVYTTYTLWHLIHVGEKEQLRSGTADLLNGDSKMLGLLLEAGDTQYLSMIMELFADGKLAFSSEVGELISRSLLSEHRVHRELAFKSLSKFNFQDLSIQDQLADIYPELQPNEKIRVLNYMKNPNQLSALWYNTLIKDLDKSEEWLVSRTLDAVKKYKPQNPNIVKLAQALTTNSNSFTKQAAIDFLKYAYPEGEP